MRVNFNIVVMTGLMLMGGGIVGEAGLYSPLQVTINLEEETFVVFEEFSGEVRIKNTFPRTVPATFNVKVFHDDIVIYEKITEIKTIFPGTNKYALDVFGIPSITDDPWSSGHWRILIQQHNVDAEYAASAEFWIVKPTETARPSKVKPLF